MLNSHYVMFIYMIHDTYFRLVAQNLIKHLDYALYEDKTVNPSISTENHNEQLREYNSKLEK